MTDNHNNTQNSNDFMAEKIIKIMIKKIHIILLSGLIAAFIVFIAVYAVMSELKFNATGIAVAEFITVIAYIAFAKLLGISTKITVSVTKIIDRSDGL